MLEIGRALMYRPKLLMMDEPSAGLAPLITKMIFEQIENLNRELGLTVLMIEQNAKKALGISDYGVVLQQGRLALDGTASEVLHHPEIGRLFLGGVAKVEGTD